MHVRTARLVAGVLGASLLMSGCTSDDGQGPGEVPEPTGAATDAPATPAPTPTADPSPTTPDPSPTDGEPTTDPSAPPDQVQVRLTGDAVGDVPNDTPEPLPRLTELLGEPDRVLTEEDYGVCGGGDGTGAEWGDLTVEMTGGALYGWHVDGSDVPENVVLPHDLPVGTTLSAVQEVTGGATELLEPYDIYLTEADGVRWWTETDAPGAAVITVSSNVLTCG